MTVRPVTTGYALDCDRCPETLEDGDLALVTPTPAQAIQAGIDSGWTHRDGQHICPRTNTAHTPAA
ncbi:hypothetical protein [Streptomyces sp. NBC_01353]|uniref:hypothetical protein n=1 Tax=Streptomyces sp. NBC_01353 TaxID=2903835 RepID=UPI002E2ECB6E|nr:hypothetical protein [Streptomyces sp. NBC_01353]